MPPPARQAVHADTDVLRPSIDRLSPFHIYFAGLYFDAEASSAFSRAAAFSRDIAFRH